MRKSTKKCRSVFPINFMSGFKMSSIIDDDPQHELTHVFFVSVCHGERKHKLIKSVHSAKYNVHQLRLEIKSAFGGKIIVSTPVLNDAGIMLSPTDRLPPRVRILLPAKLHESLARAGHFLEEDSNTDDDDTESFLHLEDQANTDDDDIYYDAAAESVETQHEKRVKEG